MARKRLSVHALSDRTKQKYSKGQLEQMEREEERVKESMSNSQLEDYAEKKLKKKEHKQLYKAFKQILIHLGVFNSIDSFSIINLIDNIEGINNAKKMMKRVIDMNDLDGYVKLQKLIISHQNQISNIFKSLNISADSRHKLQQLTSNGSLQNNEISEEDYAKLLEIIGE